MSAQRITKGFAWNHLYKLAEFGCGNLYAIAVVRKFGPELGGSYAVFLAIANTLAILAAFAVDGVLLRYLPRIVQGEKEIGSAKIEGIRPFLLDLFAFRMLTTVVLAGVIAIVLGVVPNYSSSFARSLGTLRGIWPYIIVFLFAQSCVAFSVFTLIGLLETKWVFFGSLIARGALLIAGLMLLWTNQLTLDSAVAAFTFSTVLLAGLMLVSVHHRVERGTSPGLRKEFAIFWKRVIHLISGPRSIRTFLVLPFMLYGMTTWGSDMLSTVLGRLPDVLMMRAMLGDNARDIGLYDAAARIGLVTEYVFLFGLGGTLVAVFSGFAHQDEERGTGRYTRLLQARRDIAGFQTVITTPLFAFMLAFAPLAIQIAYGPKFASASSYLIVGLAIQLTTIVAFGGGMQITSLVAIGKERVVFKNRLVWGTVNMIANYFLIQSMGGLGATIGTQLCNMGACATESVIATRLIGQSFQLNRTLVVLAIVSTSVAAAIVVSTVITDLSPLLRFLVCGCTTGALTILGYMLFKVPAARQVIVKIRSLLGRSEVLASV